MLYFESEPQSAEIVFEIEKQIDASIFQSF